MDSMGSTAVVSVVDVRSGLNGGGSGPPRRPLSEVSKRVQTLMTGSRNGGLLASLELMPMENDWEDRYQHEAAGKTFAQWLYDFSGTRVQEWRRYFDAAQRLGRSTSFRWDTAAAVWVFNKFGGDDVAFKKIVDRVRTEWKARGKGDNAHPPLSLDVVTRIVGEMFPTEPRAPRACARCAELESLLRAAGIDVPAK